MQWKSIYQKIISLALPMAGTQLISMGSGFLCMAMLAQLGHEVLAASALIFSISISVMVIGMSLLLSLSVVIGHAFGAKDYLGIGSTIQHGWLIGVIISLPLMLIFWNIYPILMLLGQEPKISLIVKQFFQASIWMVTPMMITVCNQQLCYGVHKQKIDFIGASFSVSVLLAFSYLLIFGKLGFPKLGVAGFGYARVAQMIFYFLFTTVCLIKMPFFKPFELFRLRLHRNWQALAHLLRIGWPICVQISGEMLSFAFVVTMVGWIGVTALAAYQVIIQYSMLNVVPIFALSQASGIVIGHACGSKQFDDIKKLGFASITIALCMSGIAAILFLVFPKLLASVYFDVNNASYSSTLHLTIILFAITAFSQIFDAVRNVITGGLRGLFDTRYPMIIGMLVIWLIGIPLSYFFGLVLHYGAPGIAFGSLVGMAIGAILIVQRWYIKSRHF